MVVMDRDLVGSDDFEGMCSITLDILKDQMKHDLWFQLTGLQGQDMGGQPQIHVVLQWIHSNVTFFADICNRWEITIANQIHTKEAYTSLLNKLRSNINLGLLYFGNSALWNIVFFSFA